MAGDADTRLLIRVLAYYAHRGYPLAVFEPPLRGRKNGPAHEARRTIGFTVLHPRAFDAIRWELMKRELSRTKASSNAQFPSGPVTVAVATWRI